MRASLALLVLCYGFLPGCTGKPDEPQLPFACLNAGCEDGGTVILRSSGNTWPDGSYRLSLGFDADHFECAFEVPAIFEGAENYAHPMCDGDFIAHFYQVQDCDADSGEPTCVPVPGQWWVAAFMPGTPKHMSLALVHDGVAAIEVDQPVGYEKNEPNGPVCGPTSMFARIELHVHL